MVQHAAMEEAMVVVLAMLVDSMREGTDYWKGMIKIKQTFLEINSTLFEPRCNITDIYNILV